MKQLILTFAFLIAIAFFASAQIVVTAPQEAVKPGNFEVVITASDLADTAAYQFDIYHNGNVIAPTGGENENFGCTLADTIANTMSVVCNGYEAGRLRVVVYGAYSISGSGAILRVQFHSVTSDAKSSLHFANGHFYSWSPYGEVASAYQDGYIKVLP